MDCGHTGPCQPYVIDPFKDTRFFQGCKFLEGNKKLSVGWRESFVCTVCLSLLAIASLEVGLVLIREMELRLGPASPACSAWWWGEWGGRPGRPATAGPSVPSAHPLGLASIDTPSFLPAAPTAKIGPVLGLAHFQRYYSTLHLTFSNAEGAWLFMFSEPAEWSSIKCTGGVLSSMTHWSIMKRISSS